MLNSLVLLLALFGPVGCEKDGVTKQHVESRQSVVKGQIDHSVLVRSEKGVGTGVCFRRGGQLFVLTNWHVVEGNLTMTGGKPKFAELKVVKYGVHEGKTCDRHETGAEVIAYSSNMEGYDLAVLRVFDPNFVKGGVKFSSESKTDLPFVGMEISHVGCLYGEKAPLSYTTGVLAAQGRVIEGHVYDQTTCTSFPGSSGGGVFDSGGLCLGVMTRRAGETLSFLVPTREISDWAKGHNLDWVLDESFPVPTAKELAKRRDEFAADNPFDSLFAPEQ